MKDIIKKQEELIELLKFISQDRLPYWGKVDELDDELSVLKSKMEEVSDEDIEKWAEDLYGCSGTQFGSALREVNIAIRGAKAHRDNLIKKG